MKNRSVEAYRFFFSIIICIYHFRAQIEGNYIQSGYIVVEFFFILSGYLLAQSGISKMSNGDSAPELNTVYFIKNKVKSLYPHYIFSLLMFHFVTIFCLNKYTMKDMLLKVWPEVFMIQMSGLANTKFFGNSADWYVSSLMIASLICVFLLFRFKKVFLYYIAPIASLSLYTYLYNEIGHLGTVRGYRLNTFTGTLRGIAGICLGCICYCIAKYIIENYRCTKKSKCFFSCVEIVCIAAVIWRIPSEWKTSKDFLMLVVFSTLVIIIFVKDSFFANFFDRKIFEYLGSISYAIYLNHSIFRDIFKKINMKSEQKLILYLMVVLIVSAATTELIKKFSRSKIIADPLGLILERK